MKKLFRGAGGSAQLSKIFYFFSKNNLNLGLFW